MSNRTLIAAIATTLQAWRNCTQSGNTQWETLHAERLDKLVSEFLPSGGGFDNGTQLLRDECTADKIVLRTAFHHMNDGGCYIYWTEHTINVSPSFTGFTLSIHGRNRNDIKDYIYDCFDSVLSRELTDEQYWQTAARGVQS